jgi:hypothetical protein
MRWGNYDTVNNALQFQASEVPSAFYDTRTISLIVNPVPTSQTLPASFYLSAKPSWWPASIPWPAIGPDGTVGNLANVAGRANMNPAEACYTNTMGGPADGTGAALPFRPSVCYNAGTLPVQPAPPTSLTITVH